MKTKILALILFLALIALCLGGCEKKYKTFDYEYAEQCFQLRLDKACTEHNHTQLTIHHPDLDGEICDYVFDGEKWKEIIYDKELTEWATNRGYDIPRTKEELQKRKNEHKQNRADDFIFSDKWESPWKGVTNEN